MPFSWVDGGRRPTLWWNPRLVGSLCGTETSPVIHRSDEGTFLHQAPLQGVRAKRGCTGSGERGRMPIENPPEKRFTRTSLIISCRACRPSVQSCAPDRTVSTGGRGRPAPWSPRQRSRGRERERETCLVRSVAEGESRRPSRRGVTQVSPRREKRTPVAACLRRRR